MAYKFALNELVVFNENHPNWEEGTEIVGKIVYRHRGDPHPYDVLIISGVRLGNTYVGKAAWFDKLKDVITQEDVL